MLHLKPPQPSTAPVTRGSRLQSFTKYLQQKCLDLYTPQQKIAVDESTIGYKGRLISKLTTLKSQQNGGYLFMFWRSVKVDTFEVLSRALENKLRNLCHGQINHSRQKLYSIWSIKYLLMLKEQGSIYILIDIILACPW